jgi:hypothetical protein
VVNTDAFKDKFVEEWIKAMTQLPAINLFSAVENQLISRGYIKTGTLLDKLLYVLEQGDIEVSSASYLTCTFYPFSEPAAAVSKRLVALMTNSNLKKQKNSPHCFYEPVSKYIYYL